MAAFKLIAMAARCPTNRDRPKFLSQSGEFHRVHSNTVASPSEIARPDLRTVPPVQDEFPEPGVRTRLSDRAQRERAVCAHMLAAILEELGISNRDLAALLDVDERVVRRVLRAETPLELRHLVRAGVQVAVLEEILIEALRKAFRKGTP